MSRIAGLINKEKNRRIVSAMFSSEVSKSKDDVFPEHPLTEHLATLESVIFEEGVIIDEARSKALISELEGIVNELA